VVYWIDLFTRKEYCDVLVESLAYCQQEKGLLIYGWCIMPSHVHLIIGTRAEPMQDILRDLKSFTSRKLRKELAKHPQESRKEWMQWMFERAGKRNSNNKNWQLWQQHNQPIELSENSMIDERVSYLHNNPVEAGFVGKAEHWNYSSAQRYAGRTGKLEVIMLL